MMNNEQPQHNAQPVVVVDPTTTTTTTTTEQEEEAFVPCCGNTDTPENDPDCLLLAATLNELHTDPPPQDDNNAPTQNSLEGYSNDDGEIMMMDDLDVDAVVCEILDGQQIIMEASIHNNNNNNQDVVVDTTNVDKNRNNNNNNNEEEDEVIMMSTTTIDPQQQQQQQAPLVSEIGPSTSTTILTSTTTTHNNVSSSSTNHSNDEGYDMSFANYLDSHFQAMKPEYEKMIRMVGMERGSKVLDAGCGGGSYFPILSEIIGPTGHLEALDVSPANVKAAQQLAHYMTNSTTTTTTTANNNHNNDTTNSTSTPTSGQSPQHPPIHVQVGNVTKLPFENNTFDVVWCANVTQYLSDTELSECLLEFRRILKPHGIVAVKELDLASNMIGPSLQAQAWTLYQHAQTQDMSVNVRGTLRTPQLPQLFREADLSHVNFAYVFGERRSPLTPQETEFIQSILEYHASMAQKLPLSAEEHVFWRNMERFESTDHPMKRPYYHFREGHMVVVGRFDPHSFLPM